MKRIIILIIAVLFINTSCENKNKTGKVLEAKTEVKAEAKTENNIIEAVINTDCDYYIGGKVSGRLVQNQRIIILKKYTAVNLDIHVEFITEDSLVTAYVDEKNITYLGENLYKSWFKNIFLIREYYYTDSAEEIFNNDYGKNLNGNDMERDRVLRLWKNFYSEERLRITDYHFIFGNSEDIHIYRIKSVKKENNKYIFILSNLLNEEYKIDILDNGDGIIITHCSVITDEVDFNYFSNILNIKYITYDSDKSAITRKNVFSWIDEQL